MKEELFLPEMIILKTHATQAAVVNNTTKSGLWKGPCNQDINKHIVSVEEE